MKTIKYTEQEIGDIVAYQAKAMNMIHDAMFGSEKIKPQGSNLDAGQRLGSVLANDDPEELKRQEAQYWGVPDETRDAHDFDEERGDLEDLAKDNYLGR